MKIAVVGGYYSTMATQLLNAHYNGLGETHVVNIRNNGVVKEWPMVKKSGITFWKQVRGTQ